MKIGDTDIEVDIIGNAHLPIVSWCVTCDEELTHDRGIGPFNHLGTHPDHVVVQAEGRLSVYRNR